MDLGYWDDINNIFQALELSSKEKKVTSMYSYQAYTKDLSLTPLYCLIFFIVSFLINKLFFAKRIANIDNKNEDLQNFVDNAGHELKTPLAVINSSLWIMKEKKQFDGNLIDKSIKEIENTNLLIETLRDLSNITNSSKKEHLDIWKSLEEIIQSCQNLAKSKNVQIEINVIHNFFLETNKNYFTIFFSNLINNAIKYNKDNGKVTISVLRNNVVIEDTGIGIPKEKIGKIFNRFYRVKNHRDKEGFGLGLSLVEKIANIYGWKIEVFSEEWKGSKFIIVF